MDRVEMTVELQRVARPCRFQPSHDCGRPRVSGHGAFHWESVATKNLGQAIASLLGLARPAGSGNQLNGRVNKATAINRFPDRFNDS
jgi:hypothetical protein